MKTTILLMLNVFFVGVLGAGELKLTESLDRDYWTGIRGVHVVDLEKSSKFAEVPTGSDELKSGFKALSWDDHGKDRRWANLFGQKIYGFLVPPLSGEYVFALSNDDEAAFFISSDANPDNKKFIFKNRISKYGEWQNPSKPIKLEAGKVYYVEVLHKEHAGDTYVMLGWQVPGSEEIKLVPAECLSSFKAGVPTPAK